MDAEALTARLRARGLYCELRMLGDEKVCAA